MFKFRLRVPRGRTNQLIARDVNRHRWSGDRIIMSVPYRLEWTATKLRANIQVKREQGDQLVMEILDRGPLRALHVRVYSSRSVSVTYRMSRYRLPLALAAPRLPRGAAQLAVAAIVKTIDTRNYNTERAERRRFAAKQRFDVNRVAKSL